MDKALAFIRNSGWLKFLLPFENDTIRLEMQKNILPLLIRELVENGIDIISVRPVQTLEEYFLSITH
jgi:hypothetical protein